MSGAITNGRRADLASRATRLRAAGLLQRQIADELNISRTYAQQLLDDPDGAKARARKDSYRGVCEACGARTDGSNGPANAPKLCDTCARRKQHEERYWTPERIIEAFREFEQAAGRPPGAADAAIPVAPSARRRLSAERIAEGLRYGRLLPSNVIVAREFGGWRQALAAAGMPAGPAGSPGHRTYGPVQSAALDYLESRSEECRPVDLAHALSIRPPYAGTVLRSLIDHGLVVKVGRGRYTLA